MPRWIWSVLGLGTLLAVALGFVRWPVSPAWTSQWVTGAGLGVTVTRIDSAEFVLLPWPMLRLTNLTMATAPDALRISAPAADVTVDPVTLLRGAVLVSGLTLRGPRAEVDADRLLVWSDDIATGAWPWKGRIDVVDGHARMFSATRALDEDISDVNGAVEWRTGADTLRVWASGKTATDRLAIDGRVSGRRSLRQGGAAATKLSLSAPGLELVFDGSWRQSDEASFEGALDTEIRSPRLLSDVLGFDPGWTKPVSVRGRVKASRSGVAVADAELKLAGQTFEGSLSLARAPRRPTLSATLDATSLELDALFGPLPPLLGADGVWSSQTRLPQPSLAADLDLRVSATSARWGALKLTDAAFAVTQKDALLAVKLLDVGAYGGMISGEVDIHGGPSPQAQVAATLNNADIGEALAEWGAPGFSGRGTLSVRLAAQGVSPATLTTTANGKFNVELGPGAIDGLNLEEGLRRSQRRQVEFTRDLLVGQTRFLSARAGGVIEDGKLTLYNGHTEGPGVAMAITGTADIARRNWDMRVEATQTGSDGAAPTAAPRLVVHVTGGWAAPEISLSGSPN